MQSRLTGKSPLDDIFKQLWPFIKHVLNNYGKFEALMEGMSRLVKQIMKVIPKTFMECLNEFLQIVIVQF